MRHHASVLQHHAPGCALRLTHWRFGAFRRSAASTAGFGLKAAGFGRNKRQFRVESDARMRHIWRIDMGSELWCVV
jgi:hypothetical protein